MSIKYFGEIMKIALALVLIGFATILHSVYVTNQPTAVFQIDGEELHLFASGDEFYNWLHDENGFTIIQSQTDGNFYYAERVGSELKPTNYKVGSINPSEKGIQPWLKIAPELIKSRREKFQQTMSRRADYRNRGTLNNISVFIRFSDQDEFPEQRFFYDEKFNDTTPCAISLQNYYSEVSYNQLTLPTYIYPECSPTTMISYQDDFPRAYYSPYNAVTNPLGYYDWQRTEREHALLANAVNSIASQIPIGLDIDYNNDGYVDNVCFVIRGPHDAWATLLWAHRWGLFSEDVYINGKQVYDYTFQPENQNTVRTLAHEMFHALGAPDLYHYDFDGISPVGSWDIMESGFVHMGAYMKYKYGGWIEDFPQITSSGFYSLNPLTSATNNVFFLDSPYSYNQSFVLEYRNNNTEYFDRNVPGSGLLVYRIDSNEDGNSYGPPDEVYLFRKDGSISENGSISEAYLSNNIGRTSINDYTNPRVFLNNGLNGGISIYEIGNAEETISFYVDFEMENLPPIIHIESPTNDGFYPSGDLNIELGVEEVNRDIQSVELFIDDIPVQTFFSPPYSYLWSTSSLDIGRYHIKAEVFDTEGLSSSDEILITIIDPLIPYEFAWFTDEPVYDAFCRGSIPIKVGVDFSLGETEYFVTQVALNIAQDPFGFAPIPGEVHCTVNELINGQVSSNILLDLGTFVTPMNGMYYFDIQSTTSISGDVVLIMDISSYQQILFDNLGVTGHSWLTEPDRPWVDAISRGMIGAADVSMTLLAANTGSENELLSNQIILNQNFPNPFNPETTIAFSVASEQNVTLEIFNVKGEKVKQLFDGKVTGGRHEIKWSGTDEKGNKTASGIYFYRMKTANYEKINKMILLK
jgi:M6 family metalloprotease-like protein